ncbi:MULTISPECIES: AAA family ATPase [Protofrankia]|uniref:Exodeoxyribonuclease V n=1 Tax=Candidatus Protofrankia datiscae TaxID=2716812 RepID=F8AZR1_9ACTN|nr:MULTISPECIES: AAA family ATPase [Protofrankia]AEH09668.1 Exodeoxyribonuclease V [Candidatus Protofrankia datiscae]
MPAETISTDALPSLASAGVPADGPANGTAVDPAVLFTAFCAAGLWPGLGRTTAARLPDAGIRAPSDVDATRLATVPGVPPARARRLVESFSAAGGAYAAAELLILADLPVRLVRRLVDELGPGVADALRADPWALLAAGEAELTQADRLARAMGARRDDDRRGPAVVTYLLRRAASRVGDTAAEVGPLLQAAARDGVGDPVAALGSAVEDGQVVITGELAALERYATAEQALAEGVARLLALAEPLRPGSVRPRPTTATPTGATPARRPAAADDDLPGMFDALDDIDALDLEEGKDGEEPGGPTDAAAGEAAPAADADGPEGADENDEDDENLAAVLAGLDETQLRAARTALDAGVSLLTGGPGTGKSRTVAAVVRLARAAGAQVALAAPTGRAAKRLEELCEWPASTLHRLLQAQGTSGTFARDADNPVEADLVVVDEVSMLDAELAAALVDACADGTHLLLVGDPAQLPSIGPGRVLADLLAAGVVPVTELQRLYRQSEGGGIATLATAVRAGELPPPPSGPDREVVVVPTRGAGEAAHRVVQLVTDSIPRALGIPVADIQVVTPVHGGPAGTQALNAALKQALNPGTRAGGGFDVGDRVVATANHLDDGFANGEIGVVTAVGDKGALTVAFPGGAVEVPGGIVGDLRHGWAVTVHRAQGSEWPAVVAVFPPEAGRMLTRPLIYTALTRARRHLSVVSVNGPALRAAVHRSGGRQRATLLPALLAQEVQPEAADEEGRQAEA